MRRKMFSLLVLILIILISPASFVLALASVPVTGITLNRANMTLERGDSAVLKATIQPGNASNKDILWTSSNPGIVAVQSSGPASADIRAVTAGKVTVTVTAADGGKIATCAVNVVVSLRSLGLDVKEITLVPGDQLILNVKIIPADTTNQAITWLSTNPGVASVAEVDPAKTTARNPQGKVTVHKEGETRIIVRSVPNNSITAFCTVTVLSSVPSVTEEEQPPPSVTETEQVSQGVPAVYDQAPGKPAVSKTGYGLVGLGAVLLLAVPLAYIIKRSRVAALSSMTQIIGVSGHFAGQSFKVARGKMIIGRDPTEAQIVYPQSNSLISRKHCTIDYDSNSKRYILTDLSTNGTFLSTGERLVSGKPYILKPGDNFYLADPMELFEIGSG